MCELLKFDAVIAEKEEGLLLDRFYNQVPVLKADADALPSRLALCRFTADTLKVGLGLLRIERWSGCEEGRA